MVNINTHADALHFEVASTECVYFKAVGTIPGVIVTYVSGYNGNGTGRIGSFGDGTYLAWKPPGAADFGPQCLCDQDGEYVLEGVDSSKYIRVEVVADFLSGPVQARVFLRDVYNNDIGYDDVTATEALAGDTTDYTVTLRNVSGATLWRLRFWLHTDTDDLQISDDGVSWVSPTTEATALELPDLAATATDILHIRRTITASSSSDAGVLNKIEYAFESF
jgi:hypothetical protein